MARREAQNSVEADLFRRELANLRHPLVQLAQKIDRKSCEDRLAVCTKPALAAQAIPFERKTQSNAAQQDGFARLLQATWRSHSRPRSEVRAIPTKQYSLHAPEVECIAPRPAKAFTNTRCPPERTLTNKSPVQTVVQLR